MDAREITCEPPTITIDGTWTHNEKAVGRIELSADGTVYGVVDLEQARELREALDELITELEEHEND